MARPPGRCISCEGTGLTKEHVFPDWLNSVYPKRPYHKRERFRAFDTSKQADQVARSPDYKEDTLTGRCVYVCSGCNNGWMALLQESAKPVLIPLIRGDTVSSYPRRTELTAMWAAVIASTAEYIKRDAPPAIAPHDRDYIRKYRSPPDDWQIWMGYYIGSEKSLWYEQFRFTLSLKGSLSVPLKVAPNTQVTTTIVGKLYLYVFTSVLDGIGPLPLSERLRPDLAAGMKPTSVGHSALRLQ